MQTGHRGPLLSGAGASWGRGNWRRPEACDASSEPWAHCFSAGRALLCGCGHLGGDFLFPTSGWGFFFLSPAFASSPLSTCDVSPLLLLTIRRVMELPLAFPLSSCITQVFWRGFQTPGAFSPLRMMLAKRGKGAATTSQAAGAACRALKHKDPVVAQNVAFRKTINK